MHRLIKIFLLFLVVQLPLNTSEGSCLHDEYGRAGFQPEETHRAPFEYPADQPFLFGIHPQAESAAEIGNRLPQPQSGTERTSDPFGASPPESVIKQQVTIYLYASSLIEPGLSVYRLIFPYHFFL